MFWATLLLLAWTVPRLSVGQNPINYENDLQLEPQVGPEIRILDSLHLTLSSRLLLDVAPPGRQPLKGYLGWLPKNTNITYSSCSDDDSSTESICLKYGKGMNFMVKKDEDACERDTMTCHAVECFKIEWTNHIGGAMDCFILGDEDWYGGSQSHTQRWPLEGNSRTWSPAVTGDPLHHPSGNVVENLWLTSSGYAIFVDHSVPLFVSFNDSGTNNLCFSTSNKKHPYQSSVRDRPGLSYSICSASSVKEAHKYSLHRWIEKPGDIPDESVFQYPVWSTWARYKRSINEDVVLQFAEEIKDADFPAGQMEIDDKWEDCYGSLEFDQNKFPSPGNMANRLRDIGFHTTLWVHPFCNKECECFSIGEEKKFWVQDTKGKTLEVKWWNGDSAALLDTTNPEAADWFASRLHSLQTKYDIASFKFDAGEVLWLNRDFVFYDEKANLQPNLYSKFYAELAERFGGRVEVRTGYESQSLPVFVRMYDKYSRWDYINGLRTLIPSALQMSLMGYFFILPDMIGGNNYESLNGSLPDRELYVRWLQASVFLPVIQFSIVPWDYDSEVTAISRKMVLLHEKYHNHLIEAADQSVRNGEPVIKPLWWIAPDDPEALRTDTQFLVGDNILVAPVLSKGKNKRNIYLPEGKWTDVQRRDTYEGPQWIFSYDAPLSFLPFFIKHS